MLDARGQLTPNALEGYARSTGYALACLEKERERTHETVADLSTEDLDAHAEGFPNSIGSLLYHIVLIELDWLYCEILERDIPEDYRSLFPVDARDENGNLAVMTGVGPSEHLHKLASVRNDVLEKLKGMNEDEFYRLRRLESYDVNPARVLYHLLEHEAKHGEQMAHIRRIIK